MQRAGQVAHPAERCARGCAERSGLERDRRGAQLDPARRGDEQHDAPGGERRQRAARERQIDARGERHRCRRGSRAQLSAAVVVAGDPGAEDEPERREGALGVPVGERLVEPARRRRGRVFVDDAGEQPPEQPVAGDDERAERKPRFDRASRTARAERRGDRDERAQVQHRALEVVARRPFERRPGRAQRDPARVAGQRSERGEPLARARQRRVGEQDGRRGQRPRHDQRDQPGVVEVAARGERERAGSGEDGGAQHALDGSHRRASVPSRRAVSRHRLILPGLAVLAYALAFAQRPGKLIADTKVHLYVDPSRFLSHLASAWSSTADLGHVWAGQYGGYLFPMAPWFALGDALGIPTWIVHRLWLGTLLFLAAWGVVRLMEVTWERDRGLAHTAAAVLFVVNPYVTVYADRTSVALLAYAALPWLLLCVNRGLRDPHAWRWPAAFALVLTATGGGVNVAVTGWLLVGPLMLVLYDLRWGGVALRALVPYGLRLAAAVIVASAWWVVPVIVHARYGTNFLPFTEQPGTIWGTTSISESLRLMGFWTSYIGVGFGGRLDPFAGQGHVLLFSKTVVVAGLLVPALVLGGFIWTRRARYGPFFLAMTLVGVVIMAAGWPEGTPLRRGLTFTYNHTQALQFLRTTYKAGPLVALGLAVLGGGALSAAVARIPELRRRTALVAATAVLVAVAAWPLVTGNAVERQLEFKLPVAWKQLARDLDKRPDSSRALVEPGQLFAFQRWGGTIDNVLPALTDHPVATRYIVPFSDLRSADLQWGVDDLIGQERALPGQLRPLLDLMAVGDLVVSSDDDRRRGGGQAPLEAMAQLAPVLDLPGKDYGSRRRVQPAAGRIAPAQEVPELHRVELGTQGIVRVLPRGPATIVDGAAQGVEALASYGDLPDDRPTRYAADLSRAELRKAAVDGATIAISDSNRRQAFVAARLRQNRGAVLPADQDVSADGTYLDPFDRGSDAQTVAVQRGLERISSPFSPQTTQFPEHRPFAAVDGRPSTAWLGDRFLAPQRRHLDLTFSAPRAVPYIDLLPYSDSRGITRNVIVNGRLFGVHPGWNRLPVRIASTDKLKVELFGTRRPKTGSAGGGGIRELRLPGLKVDELLRPPMLAEQALRGADLGKTRLEYLFDRFTADLPGKVGRFSGPAQAGLVRDARDPEPQLARTIQPPAPREWTLDGWVHVDVTTPDSLLDRVTGTTGPGTADSSARFENRPGYRSSSAFDGDPSTAWVGQWIPGKPTFLSWTTQRPVAVRRLRLVPAPFVARVPKEVSLNGRSATVAADGTVTFA
ncbi:MAG: DUF3367 domain-containing protein, partial [Actinobacteria bacterium]